MSVFIDLFAIETIAINDVQIGGHEVHHPTIPPSLTAIPPALSRPIELVDTA